MFVNLEEEFNNKHTSTDHWSLHLPATNIKSLSVERCSNKLQDLLINGNVFTYLQRFYAENSVVEALEKVDTGGEPSSLRSLRFYSKWGLEFYQKYGCTPPDYDIIPERCSLLESLNIGVNRDTEPCAETQNHLPSNSSTYTFESA